MLLDYGAKPEIVNNKGEKAECLSSKANISKLLGKEDFVVSAGEKPPEFTPAYIRNPPLYVDLSDLEPISLKRNAKISSLKEIPPSISLTENPTKNSKFLGQLCINFKRIILDIIFRVRIENSNDDDDCDYIEFEMEKKAMSYKSLIKKCCEELEIDPEQFAKIKCGLVRLRNDCDVQRLTNYSFLNLYIK